MTLATRDAQKRAAAIAAVAEVRSGMIVGLGTGTTAAFAIAALGEECRRGLAVRAVATSRATEAAALAAGIATIDFADVPAIDLCIDGVDEIDPEFRAIKGGGGAMLREKIVAASAARMIAIADAAKPVWQLGAAPVPVEILAFARAYVAAAITASGGTPTLRQDQGGARVLTDQGNPILDCRFAAIEDPAALAARLAVVPGILGHGLFVDQIDALYLGTTDGVIRSGRPIETYGGTKARAGSAGEQDRCTIARASEAHDDE